jgi:hypothetical protein
MPVCPDIETGCVAAPENDYRDYPIYPHSQCWYVQGILQNPVDEEGEES